MKKIISVLMVSSFLGLSISSAIAKDYEVRISNHCAIDGGISGAGQTINNATITKKNGDTLASIDTIIYNTLVMRTLTYKILNSNCAHYLIYSSDNKFHKIEFSKTNCENISLTLNQIPIGKDTDGKTIYICGASSGGTQIN